MRGSNTLRAALLATAAACAASSSAASAQTAAAQQPESPADMAKAPSNDGDVVVTAQRRQERLQDVPVAVTAVSGETLQNLGLGAKMDDLRFVAPSLQFGQANGPLGEGFKVRGVGTVTFTQSSEQSVGVVIDNVVMGTTGMGITGLSDIERVEILRGPQGMLFGKNASAGLINITTKRPVLGAFEGRAHAQYGTDDDRMGEVIVNVPLGDTVALRASGYYSARDGYVRNVVNGDLYNNRHEYGFKAKLLFKPSDDFDMLFIGDYSRRNPRCCIWTERQYAPGSPVKPVLDPLGIVASPRNEEVALDGGVSPQVNVNRGISAEINGRIGSHTLTSVTAYRDYTYSGNMDSDQVPRNWLNLNGGGNKATEMTEELRLTSPSDRRLEYVAGLYYFYLKFRGQLIQAGSFAPIVGTLPFLFTTTGDRRTNNTNESYAAFGQFTVHLTDAVSVFAGGRYTHDDLSLQVYSTPIAGYLQLGPAVPSTSGHGSNDNFSYRVGAQVRLAPDVMLYGSYARGYKGPAINNNAAAVGITRPEIPTAYELGLKSQFLDRRVTLNLAAFRTDFKDFQAQVYDTSVTPGTFRFANAGGLRTQGVEVEYAIRPAPGFSISGGVSYTDAKFTDFLAPCYPNQTVATGCVGTIFDAAGQRLTNAPKWAYNVIASIDRPVGDRLRAHAQASWFYRGDAYFLTGDPGSIQRGYGILNGNIGIGSANDGWRISAFAKNLLDRKFVGSIFSGIFDSRSYVQIPTVDSRRTLGVMLDLNF